MYHNDHAPPHFHARYSGQEAVIGIDSLEVLDGELPPRVLGVGGTTMTRIQSVEALADFRVRLGFTDGTMGEVDLAPYLRGPVFEPLLADRRLFAAVRVDPECETIVWPNGADMDPDVLYDLAHRAAAHER